MRRTILMWAGLVVAGMISPSAFAQQAASSGSAASPYRAMVTRYCAVCHNERLKTANLFLDKADVEHPAANPELWEKVVRKLRARAMPPRGLPRPDEATYASFEDYLETALDRAAAANPNPGRPSEHRLNRSEYANAIRDLLGLEVDTKALLPPDEQYFGFDNNGSVLTVSPLLMERYLLAAGRISRLAVGDAQTRAAAQEYKVSEAFMQDDRQSEDLPFGSRGGTAIHHNFPADGEYDVRIRLQRNYDGFIRGLVDQHLLDVRVDGKRVKLFKVGGVHKGLSGPMFTRNDPDYRGDPEQLEYELSGDEALETRFQAKAGEHLLGVAFLKRTTEPEGVRMGEMLLTDLEKYRGGDPAVDTVTITGPYNPSGLGETVSRRKIFVCHPTSAQEEPACAKRILKNLTLHAYRRPGTDDEIQDLLKLYNTGRKESGFEGGIEMALQRILSGPEFLFRVERDPAGIAPNTAYPVSDYELASRLSFFLWSSIPDDELLDLAAKGRLRDKEVMAQQVRRMLADPRSDALVNNFAGQWLDMRNISLVSPDQRVYPDFDDELRTAFHEQTRLFFKALVREDHPLMDLLTANFTYVNERLARHYGIPNVYGTAFRRVTLKDPARFGLLGQGTILTSTSRANRTSPVLRGKWVLDNLLGVPPPPPPANVVASLVSKGKDGRKLTMREQMDAHRQNPVCSACHSLMDPIGFSLDNFNGVGQWRTSDAGAPLDTTGVLFDGTKFDGPLELRKVLVDRQKLVAYTVASKLLTYALGRALESYDQPAVRGILRESAPSKYRWSSLILAIVNSTPFQMRRSRDQ